MVKTLKLFLSGTKKPMTLKVGLQQRVLKYFQVYSNDNPGLTLTYFTARSNLVPYSFVCEKDKTMDFSETTRKSPAQARISTIFFLDSKKKQTVT